MLSTKGNLIDLKNSLTDQGQVKYWEGNLDLLITGIAYNSNNTEPGNLFVAVKGYTTDGHLYIEKAIQRGAIAIIAEDDFKNSTKVTKLLVHNSRIALSLLSSEYFSNPTSNLKLIGVTGTNGKTSVTYLVRDMLLNFPLNKIGVIGTTGIIINDKMVGKNPNTTPESKDIHELAFQMVNTDHNYMLMEVTSHALDQRRVDHCDFSVGVYTNLTYEHLDWHKDMDTYFKSKARLFELLRPGSTAVINVNNFYGRELLKLISNDVNIITYDSNETNHNANLTVSRVRYDKWGNTNFCLNTPHGKYEFSSNLFGDYNIDNLLAAIGCGMALGLSISEILPPLSASGGAPGRFQRLQEGQNFEVIVDYAHTPDGFQKLFTNVERLRKKNSSLTVVFGSAGHFRDQSKRPIMGEIASRFASHIILTEEDSRIENTFDIMEMIKSGIDQTNCKVTMIEDRSDAIEYAIKSAQKDDIVIILGKGDETSQEINHSTEWNGDIPTALRILKRLDKQ